MRKLLKTFIFLLIVSGGSVACASASQEYIEGETLLTEDFSQADAWESFIQDETELQVADGAYHVQTGSGGYIWGLNNEEHSDVVIQVSASQLSLHPNNAYGVMCRADPSNNGDGYYFLISGDGFYSIAKGEGDEVKPIIDWTSHGFLSKGQATSSIRAVCIEDYLALYVNNMFVAETTDSSYTSGFAGLAAAAFEDGDVEISFDDLTITSASLSSSE